MPTLSWAEADESRFGHYAAQQSKRDDHYHLTVSDGPTNATRSFLLTVTAVNDPQRFPPSLTKPRPRTSHHADCFRGERSRDASASLNSIRGLFRSRVSAPGQHLLWRHRQQSHRDILPATNQSGARHNYFDRARTDGSRRKQLIPPNGAPGQPRADFGPHADSRPQPQFASSRRLLSGITSGADNEIQALAVAAVSSAPGIVPDPRVSYTSANNSGTLTVAPLPGVSGTATISSP